ncbi:hypothetical protein A3D66_00430 [Candidatus Kaiserbacteria bacterium RIFCSPHIGHO2_02_FULL_50_9]|uniref:DUF2214 domain-containing protein n=1 Tax=Candidatus Kaiserbacteria bacterium RIFCSPLOWO2_01_FULL_51_21 TaxID=1798508 RepID=A0A1F6ED00_9BACT|nr:MAG: hypothetical protein A2761_01910 [Candidatus Kaiserbacteria bacterium RIFCSPHIGHO2_01_FULL_51_33]OGG63191.1 MAG: hypothetical protein A3D66_00430 [Candidatus Kaiserbacteria bacterium RIFCSPHIGHO2_02_FULL_50_9]OGG71555.1 MAG: hypothetical protein A3A35_00210 [Candidatus Kaiserbacteria bacterium RIFCSPLOWO2_01_FULL_51_21]
MEFFDFADKKTLFLTVHLFGIALGAGGAFISDAMFFKTARDNRISRTEMGFLLLGSRFVFAGLILLLVSGALLFSLDPERYLASSKFLAKMTVVAVIAVNGVFFHTTHIPRLRRHVGTHLPSSDEFGRYRMLLLGSGAVSLVSWALAIVLGTFKSIPFSYEVIVGGYVAVVALALLISFILRDYLLPTHHR